MSSNGTNTITDTINRVLGEVTKLHELRAALVAEREGIDMKIAEVDQALVVLGKAAGPRARASGVDHTRLGVTAPMQERAKYMLGFLGHPDASVSRQALLIEVMRRFDGVTKDAAAQHLRQLSLSDAIVIEGIRGHKIVRRGPAYEQALAEVTVPASEPVAEPA